MTLPQRKSGRMRDTSAARKKGTGIPGRPPSLSRGLHGERVWTPQVRREIGQGELGHSLRSYWDGSRNLKIFLVFYFFCQFSFDIQPSLVFSYFFFLIEFQMQNVVIDIC